MNLVLHQFKKDIRQFRWQLGVYMGSFIFLLATVAPHKPSHVGSIWLLIPIVLSWAAYWSAGMLLTVEVIQAEPHFGDNAFWLTRPLTARTVLAAKGLFLFVCMAVPAIIAWVMMWMMGDGTVSHEPDTAKASLYALYEWAVVGIVVALAALSHTTSRAITLGVAGYAIYFFARFVREYSMAGLWNGEPAKIVTMTQLLTCAALGPAVLLVMAGTRRWAWGLATALGGIVLLVVLPVIFWALD